MKKPVLPKFSQECVLCNCNEINDRMDNACFSEDSISDDLYQQEFFECEFKNVSIHSKMISCLFADVIFVKRKPKLCCKKDRLPEEALPAPLDGFTVLFILIV